MPSRAGLRMRPLRAGDEQHWFELLQDPVQRAFGTPDFVAVPGSAGELTERIDRELTAVRDGEPATFALAEADSRLVGTVSWRREVPEPLKVVEVGYAVHPAERRRGVGRTGLELIAGWLLLDAAGPGVERVQLDHSVENPASCRVAASVGFEREGVRRGFLPLRGPDGVRRHDVCLHGLLRSDLAGLIAKT